MTHEIRCRWIAATLFLIAVTVILPAAAHAQKTPTRPQIVREKQNIPAEKSSSKTVSQGQVPGNPVYNRIVRSTGLIVCNHPDGSVSTGTGWVLDAERRLMVTNHHVIEGLEECRVFFPEFVDGRLVTDMDSLTPSRAIRGVVADSDQKSDLAIIQLDRLSGENPALPLAPASATPGQRIHSIAGNTVGSKSLWIYSTGYVRQVARGQLANNFECMLLESDMATNQGNSGGPVCDDDGNVVAVVEGHRTDARLISIYVDLEALNAYLADGLRCVNPKTEEDLLFAAERHLGESRPSIALRLATAALKLNGKSSGIYAVRGWCWIQKDDMDSAKGDFEEALKLDPQSGDAHCGLGEVTRAAGEYETSIAHFTSALRNDPECLDYLLRRAATRLEWGDPEAAHKDYVTACKQDPGSNEAIRGLAISDIQLGNFQEGLDRLQPVFGQYSEDAETNYSVGSAFEGLQKYEEAENFYRRTLSLQSDHPEAHRDLGAVLIIQQKFDESLQLLTVALKALPDDSWTNYYYGLAMVANGDPKSGRKHLNRAMKLDPENEEIKAGSDEVIQSLQADQ